jgi:hypothetical protein
MSINLDASILILKPSTKGFVTRYQKDDTSDSFVIVHVNGLKADKQIILIDGLTKIGSLELAKDLNNYLASLDETDTNYTLYLKMELERILNGND